jgi:hypothetical protein
MYKDFAAGEAAAGRCGELLVGLPGQVRSQAN